MSHGKNVAQKYVVQPMAHGLPSCHVSWPMRCCTTLYNPWGMGIVQHCMAHQPWDFVTLYGSWVMGKKSLKGLSRVPQEGRPSHEGSPNYSKWVPSDHFGKMMEWLANVNLGEPPSDEEKAQSWFGIGWVEEAARAEAEAHQDFEDEEIEDLVDTHSSPVPHYGSSPVVVLPIYL